MASARAARDARNTPQARASKPPPRLPPPPPPPSLPLQRSASCVGVRRARATLAPRSLLLRHNRTARTQSQARALGAAARLAPGDPPPARRLPHAPCEAGERQGGANARGRRRRRHHRARTRAARAAPLGAAPARGAALPSSSARMARSAQRGRGRFRREGLAGRARACSAGRGRAAQRTSCAGRGRAVPAVQRCVLYAQPHQCPCSALPHCATQLAPRLGFCGHPLCRPLNTLHCHPLKHFHLTSSTNRGTCGKCSDRQ